MITNMVLAQNTQFGVRVFIGCYDSAIDFAAWMQDHGWRVTIEQDVESLAVPRTGTEEEMARVLCMEYERARHER